MPSPHNTADFERYDAMLREARAIQGISLGKDAWRRLRLSRASMASLVFLILIALAAFFTPLMPLQSPREVHVSHGLEAPSLSGSVKLDSSKLVASFGELDFFNHGLLEMRVAIFGEWTIPSICGRDDLGRDLLSRLFWGARVSLLVGVVATLVSLVIGVSYGAIAGYLGGRTDNLMMRLVDILYSVPFIFVVIFIVTILSEPSVKAELDARGIDRIKIFFVVVGAIYWLTMARVVRGQVISLKNQQFVEAARAIGATRGRIIFRHLVPNVLSIVIVYLTLTIPSVMLFEAFLSFLGLGVEPPDVSWGQLANKGFEVITPVVIYWWLIVFPGLALGLTLYALNFLGDGLRDALDPRLKNK